MNKKRILMGLGAFAFLGLTTVLTSCGGEKTYTVKFLDGQTELSSSTVTSGYNVEVPTAPTSDGKIFNGWYADEALTKPFDFGSIIEGDTNVYAAWVNEFTVTFKDGSKILSTTTVTSGYNVKAPANPTAKSGKTFAGWFADAALTKPFNFGSVITSATTVYAKWDSVYHNVNLYIDGNTLWKTVAVEEGETLAYEGAPTKNYRKFTNKWYTDAACENLFNTATAVEEEINLYAGWDVETEPVTYKFNYTALIAKYDVSVKTTEIETDGIFYLEPGMYFETKYKNLSNDKIANDPDFNNQQHSFWFTVTTGGTLSFDWKDRGSLTKFSVYKVPTVASNDEKPSYTEDNLYKKQLTSDLQVHYELALDGPGTYIVVPDGNVMIQQLQFTDTVEKAAPQSISINAGKTNFLVGSEFTSKGLSCTLNYANGRKEVLAEKTSTVEGYTVDYSAVNLSEEGTYPVKVKYTATDKYVTVPCEETYYIDVFAVDSIEAYVFGLDGSRNTIYNDLVYIKDAGTLKTNHIYVHATGSIGDKTYTELLNSSAYTFDNPTTDSLGRKTVTITYANEKYGNKTATFEIEVADKLFDENDSEVIVYADASLTEAKKVKYGDMSSPAYSDYVDDSTATYAFPSVTEALQYLKACGVSKDATKYILLKDGTYEEKVFIDIPNVYLAGYEGTGSNIGSNSNVVIKYDAMNGLNAPNGENYSTDGAATFTIASTATNCYVTNVTLMNKYNTNELYNESLKITSNTQATAVLVRGDMARFDHVSFSGYHDTLYADKGRQYYDQCYIEGRTDYIFGADATAYFNDCTMKTIGAGLTEKNGGYVIATKGTKGQSYGYIFDGCRFTADDQTQLGSVSLARGWESNMTLIIMNSEIDGHFSKGTYGQGYYEKTFANEEEFKAALAIGVFTYDATDTEKPYKKLSTTAEFDSTGKYYIQLNDRYTKMNADPVAAQIFEYENTGDGAIAYTEELADKYKAKTFTLLSKNIAKDKEFADNCKDENKVFAASNTPSYGYNWEPNGIAANITINGLTTENYDATKYSLSLTNAYVDNYLVDSQISAITSAIKKSLKEGYNLIGIYTDSTFKTEFTSKTKLTANTTVYARIVEGTLEEKTMSYSQANATNEGWTITGLSDSKYNIISATPGREVSKSDGKGAISNESITIEDGINTYWASASTTFKSPTITDSGVREIAVQIYGGTSDTNDPIEMKITAYNAANQDKGSVIVSGMGDSSTNGKRSGYASLTKNGSQKSEYITVTATDDISYFVVSFTGKKFGGSAITKNYGITSIDAKYEVIKKAEKQYEDKLDAYYFEGTTTNTEATAVYTLTEEINGTTGTLGDLTIDGTTGKLNPRGSDSQMNAGCKITFTAKGDGQFVITNHTGYHNYTIKAGDAAAVEAAADTTTVQIVKGTTYVIEATNTSYLYSLLVSYKVEKQSSSTETVTTTYDFDWNKIKSNLTTTAYYYKVSNNDEKPTESSEKYQENGVDVLCYDKIKINTEILQKAFDATVNSTAVDTTPIVSIGDGAEIKYRDGVKGKDGVGTPAQKIAPLDTKCANSTKSIEVSANKKGMTFTFTGTGTIKLNCCSTGSSNTTWFALKDADGKLVAANTTSDFTEDKDKENYYKITGSSGKDITFTISEAGTYTIYVSNDNPLRIFDIVVTETK